MASSSTDWLRNTIEWSGAEKVHMLKTHRDDKLTDDIQSWVTMIQELEDHDVVSPTSTEILVLPYLVDFDFLPDCNEKTVDVRWA